MLRPMIAMLMLLGVPAAGQEREPAQSALDVLARMPESRLPTECAAANQYRDRRVVPGFYANPHPPEFEGYARCLVAEARRDGGRKRRASSASFPAIGSCHRTRITTVSGRFGGRPGREEGTVIGFANRLWLIDYGYVPAAARSRVGDAAVVCVHDLPEDCPADDLRGIGYRARDLRTGESWLMGDSQHLCRGA
jgi:hypothetical protein